MYFASNDERRWIELSLQADARQIGVADELRGWRWHQPPLRPIYRAPLDASAISVRECPTGRDLYLASIGIFEASVGAVGHETVLKGVANAAIQEAKHLVQLHGVRSIDHLERRVEQAHRRARALSAGGGAQMEADLWTARLFELRRVLDRVIDVTSRFAVLGSEGILAHALPLSVDVPVDARGIGVGQGLTADAVCWADMTIFAVATESLADRARQRVTAVALALECATGRPVDIGCIVCVRVVDGHLEARREYHVIGNEERQLFVEQRDDLMRVVDSEADPGLPSVCPASCGYLSVCRPPLAHVPERHERRPVANLPAVGAARLAAAW